MKISLKTFLKEMKASVSIDKNEIENVLRRIRCKKYEIQDDGYVDAHQSVTFERVEFDNIPIQFGACDFSFTIKDSNITSLEGCPHTVDSTFELIDLPKLETLVDAPVFVDAVHIVRCHNLKNLKGLPTVSRWVAIGGNDNLTSLEGIQEEIYDVLDLTANALTNFEHFPKRINGDLHIGSNPITSLRGISDHIEKINGEIRLDTWKIKTGGIGLILIDGLTEITDVSTARKVVPPLKVIEKYLGRPEDIYQCQAELIDAGWEAFAEL